MAATIAAPPRIRMRLLTYDQRKAALQWLLHRQALSESVWDALKAASWINQRGELTNRARKCLIQEDFTIGGSC